MRLARRASLLLVAVSILAVGDARARYVGNLNLFVGQAWLNHGDWAPVDQQREYGLMLAFGEERAPIHFAVDAFVSKDEVDDPYPAIGSRVKGSSTELAIGVRKVWELNVTHPQLGAGAIITDVEEELAGRSAW